MKHIPFKAIGAGSAILTVLIIIRCLVSIGRVLYYGGDYWLSVIQEDPWLYVGVATAAISVLCFSLALLQERQAAQDDESFPSESPET